VSAGEDDTLLLRAPLADNLDPFPLEHEPDAGTNDGVIVDEQDAHAHDLTLDPPPARGNNRSIPDPSLRTAGGTTAEDIFLRIVEEVADALYVIDHDGRFMFLNRPAVELFGYEHEAELLGKDSHATVHYKRPDGSPFPAAECPLLRPRTTGETVRVDDDWFVRRDGTIVPVAYSSAPFVTDAGTSAVVAMRDMTKLRSAEEELRLLQSVTMLITSAEDFEAAVATAIRTVCEQTGWVAGEMWIPTGDGARLELAPGWWASSPAQEAFFREASAPQTMAPGEGLPGAVWQSKQPVWIDVETTRRKGPRIETARRVGFVAGVGVPVLAEGEVVAVLGFFADHRRLEDERWTRSFSTIAAQLGPILLRKRAENQLADQAVELARSNADLHLFAELIAHELQQPVAAVVRMLGTAEDEPADHERLLARALPAARRLQESIEGLLRYASVGRPEAEAVSAGPIVEAVLDDLSLELEEAGAVLIRHELPTVRADPAQVRAVLHNLVANALRYRNTDPLRIEIGSREDGERAILFVRDNGRGIRPEDHHRIFELFRRGASGADVPGIGIGLALSRRIVEAHGGELWVESTPGEGSTFFFSLPPAG
jgi:PAS domain S-box-containing protein